MLSAKVIFFLLRTALKPLNWIWQNLIDSKISTSSTKFVFLGRSENQDVATNVAHCTQVHDMWPFGPVVSSLCKIMATLSKRWHIVLSCTICGPLGLLLFLQFSQQKKDIRKKVKNGKGVFSCTLNHPSLRSIYGLYIKSAPFFGDLIFFQG